MTHTTTDQWLFLINPDASRCDVDTLTTLIRQTFSDIQESALTLHFIRDLKELSRLFGEPLRQGTFTRVVAAGGDGTVQQALHLVATYNRKVPFGILPVGTGNLLAKYLEIPEGAAEALTYLKEATPTPLHISKVNDVYAALLAGMGLDADIMSLSTTDQKKRWGPLAYVWSAIQAGVLKKKAWFHIRVDGRRHRHWADGVMVIHRNAMARAFLPVDLVADDADDALDVCVIRSRSKLDVFRLVDQLMRGNYQQEGGVIRHYRGTQVKVKAYPRQRCQVDGDVIRQHHLDIKLLPNHVQVMLKSS